MLRLEEYKTREGWKEDGKETWEHSKRFAQNYIFPLVPFSLLAISTIDASKSFREKKYSRVIQGVILGTVGEAFTLPPALVYSIFLEDKISYTGLAGLLEGDYIFEYAGLALLAWYVLARETVYSPFRNTKELE